MLQLHKPEDYVIAIVMTFNFFGIVVRTFNFLGWHWKYYVVYYQSFYRETKMMVILVGQEK